MTGFASLTHEGAAATVTVTVKGVNHRFLDLQLRLPSTLAPIESRLRAIVQQKVARGRIEATVAAQGRFTTAAIAVEVNDGVVESLSAALERARERGLVAGPLTPGDLLRFPQAITVTEAKESAAPEVFADVESALGRALDQLNVMRASEGLLLRGDLDARRVLLGEMFERAAAAAEAGAGTLRARLADRVKELQADAAVDAAAIAQEIVRFANRSDITEETVRFRAHLEHWRGLSDAPEPCGRKLDFLLQEMNREVNTLGSKAEGLGVTELVVALKAELEKMREQVQNVE
ncbi:MAG TPA: YicC/YloC family endoribonuclease [Vicinamibacterales bacterium]|nr:YicC/YloC family endoribonuclease [Vicinamibacterales bacterium]